MKREVDIIKEGQRIIYSLGDLDCEPNTLWLLNFIYLYSTKTELCFILPFKPLAIRLQYFVKSFQKNIVKL